MPEYNLYPAVDGNYSFPPSIRKALARSPEVNEIFTDELEARVTPVVAETIGKDATIVAAAAAAVNADPKVSMMELRMDEVELTTMTAYTDPTDRLEVRDEWGEPVVTIEDLSSNPYIKGSPTPIAEYVEGDSFELRDDFGGLIFAIDDLYINPRLRGSTAAGGDTGLNKEMETHFIILAGQSNSMGVGTPSPKGTNDPLDNLFVIPQRGSEKDQKVIAVEPLSHPYNNPTANSIGHGWTVARQYALEHPNVRVVILPLAMSGAGFFYSSNSAYTWAPSRIGEAGMTNLYTEAVDRATHAINQYEGTRRVALILWHQGEADAVGNTTKTQYEDELKSVINGFRSNIPFAKDAPVVIGQTGWEFRNVRRPGTWEEIDAAHKNMPNLVSGTAFAEAPPQGYMNSDNTHFTGLGQKLLAQSMIQKIQAATYNI